MPQYKPNLIENIYRLGQQLKQKCYRVNDIKRIFIPKSNGKQRPLGLSTVEFLLNALYAANYILPKIHKHHQIDALK